MFGGEGKWLESSANASEWHNELCWGLWGYRGEFGGVQGGVDIGGIVEQMYVLIDEEVGVMLNRY